ncbi:hypothetical protein HBI24_012590 [Parastagonospora nodorum]|nr:hypothetical protein HBH61_001030 [Parastagonospora nodorum]KAH5045391.1 hypothetical protein HBI75_010940 [Parastagonospora nodorum]KAH5055154.1 hypothetical protein HBH96_134330 [Parastagonospora nodorum]KAH5329493.1 hypothetical protein HBI11_021140 [Parastagonospora nodorum]KAH5593672.1 hypothetical protein HBI24_012590 [Parastagonospora nodorum]
MSAPKRKYVDDLSPSYKRAIVGSSQVGRDVQAGPVDPRRDTTEYMRSLSRYLPGFNSGVAPPVPVLEPPAEVRLDPPPPLTSSVLTFEKLDRPKHQYIPRDTNRVRRPNLLLPEAQQYPQVDQRFALYHVVPPESYQKHTVERCAGGKPYKPHAVIIGVKEPVGTPTDASFEAMFGVKQAASPQIPFEQPVVQHTEPYSVQAAHLPHHHTPTIGYNDASSREYARVVGQTSYGQVYNGGRQAAFATAQSKDFEVASEYLESARREIGDRKPHVPQIPAIPKAYHFDFHSDIPAFKPSEIWSLRHLRPNDRSKIYLGFVFYYKTMIVTPPKSPKWWQAWSVLKDKTAMLRIAELKLYTLFSPRQGENQKSRAKREAEWVQLVGDQDCAWSIDPATQQLRRVKDSTTIDLTVDSETAVQGPTPTWKAAEDFLAIVERRAEDLAPVQETAREIVNDAPKPVIEVSDPVPEPARQSKKRPAESDIEIDPGQVRPPAKTARGPDNDSPSPEGAESPKLPPLPAFKTTVRDTLEEQKKNGFSGTAPRYRADEKELGGGRTSKYAWLAHYQTERVADQAKLPRKPELWGYTDEKNAALPYYKRQYSGDSVGLPDHPSENIEDYATDSLGRYQCFHTEGKCAMKDGKCGHKCCTEGNDLKGLKSSIAKGRDTYRKAVVLNVCRKLLDDRHIFWGKLNAEQEKIAVREKAGGRVYKKRNPKAQAPAPAPSRQAAIPAKPAVVPQVKINPKAQALTLSQQAAVPAQTVVIPKAKKTPEEEFVDLIAYRREDYARTRHYPDFEYFDKWWNAARLKKFKLPATAEEQAMWQKPGPHRLRDAPSEAQQKRLDAAARQKQEAEVEIARKKKEAEANIEREKQQTAQAKMKKKSQEAVAAEAEIQRHKRRAEISNSNTSHIEPANEAWLEEDLDDLFED